MKDINIIAPVNDRVEQLYDLLFKNEMTSVEEDKVIDENNRSRYINHFLLYGDGKYLTIDKTFIELLIERCEKNLKDLAGTLEIRSSSESKSFDFEKISGHVLLCVEMVKSWLDANETTTDISGVDIILLQKIMNAYSSIRALVVTCNNSYYSASQKDMFKNVLESLLNNLPDAELVAFKCYCGAIINNKILRNMHEEDFDNINDAYLRACSTIDKRHEKTFKRFLNRIKNISNIQQSERNFDI